MARASHAKPGKTVRFTRVVERSGEPHVHTLWVAPEKDPELKRALAANRVLSVEPSAPGGHTDIGRVGFDPKHPPAQLLIFPKSLKRFADARVVGLKFDLIEQPRIVAASGADDKARTRARKARRTQAAVSKNRRTLPESSEPEPSAAAEPEQRAEKKSHAPPSRAAKRTAPPSHDRHSSRSAKAPAATLLREVRAALKELERGKVVAAHRRLERAATHAEKS